MKKVVGIRFKEAGKIYYFDPEDLNIDIGDHVIVETARGVEYGYCVKAGEEVMLEDLHRPLKPVIRIADELDKKIHQENQDKAVDAFEICKTKIKEHKMEMHLVDAEFTFDNNKVLFYFTADGRVDFRELVKDLANIFRCRVELRQIGVRDKAKIVGGVGSCGQVCCCKRFMGDFSPVSIKMVKDQELSLNPSKISGACGRLMCCLKFEHEAYECARKQVPRKGTVVSTEYGEGPITGRHLLDKKVNVLIREGEHADETHTFHLADVEVTDKRENRYGDEDYSYEED